VKKSLLFLTLILLTVVLKAQKIDSIFFHLYTDSLKKGTYNYINVDGKLSNGIWKPLTAREVEFTSSACRFSGNELIVPPGFKGEKITIKAVLKSNPAVSIEKTVWIKRNPDPEVLPTQEELMRSRPKNKTRVY
jgi:hypothetical protein